MVNMHQSSFFDGTNKYKIQSPIRLISLFSGYDSQLQALKYLGANVESWRTCEWAVKSIQALKDLHFGNDNNNYSEKLKIDEICDFLFKKGISQNYNEPMKFEQIKRLGEQKIRQIYNNIKAIHNMVNIQQVKGDDLGIVDTDKYCYIMTYSFPCQDLSLAGLQKGMEKGSGTRSGLLWEVERILDECGRNLPQILLMENVPDLIGTNNIKHFASWLSKLESLGYKCYWKILNAKDYGIPQNRERCFMVSILGDYYYTFPQKIKLERKLKDMLEYNVDEKYYLSDKMIKYIKSSNSKYTGNNNKSIINRDIAASKTTREGNTRADCSDYICEKLPANMNLKCLGIFDYKASDKFLGNRNRFNKTEVSPTILTNHDYGVVVKDNLKTQLCNDLIANGKVQEYDVIRHSYSTSRMENWKDRNVEQNNISPTLDTRCDCLGAVINNNNIYNLFFTIFDLCCIINTKEKDKYERSRELLQILWEEIGKKEIWQEIRRFISIQEKKILQSNLYENGIYEDRKLQSRISSSPSNSEKYNESITNREKMFNMWEDWKTRYTPQRWELSKQQFRQFNLFMQELSYETTQGETSVQDMWQADEGFRILQQTLFKIQEIWRPIENKISNGLRIRKLSPRECWRLMGIKDEDFEKIAQNQSNASQYHLAGDSIVIDVLIAIFKELL